MKITKHEARMGILFVLPAVILFSLFTAYPLVKTIVMSVYEWDGFSNQKEFIGLRHFIRVFHDGVFWLGMRNVIILALAAFATMNPIALLLAVMVTGKIKGSKFYGIIFYLPVMISGIVVGFVWSWMFNTDYGLINRLFEMIGLGAWTQDWLNTPTTAIIAISVASIWQGIGGSFILFWASLQNIPADYYESSDLDGANFWEKIYYITLPSISSMMTVIIILTAIGSVNTYQIVLALTKGGPAGTTTVPIKYIFDMAQEYGNFGYATAMSVVLGLILFAFSLLRMYLSKKED